MQVHTPTPSPGKEFKVAAIAADLTNYIKETTEFESKNVVIEKHVSSQIVQLPAPKTHITKPGQPAVITTVMVSVLYIYEVEIQK